MGSHLSSLSMFFTGEPTLIAIALFVVLVAIVVIGLSTSIFGLLYASFWKTGRPRRLMAIRSLIGFLVFGAALVSPSVDMLVKCANEPDSGTLTQIHNPAPDFAISDTDGKPFHLADCRGKVVLLNFFATWCVPCQKELPHLQAIWEEFENDSEFCILAIGREESDEALEAFKTERSFTFRMAADSHHVIYGEFASKLHPPHISHRSRWDDHLSNDWGEGDRQAQSLAARRTREEGLTAKIKH
jgi:peroxiredoxin